MFVHGAVYLSLFNVTLCLNFVLYEFSLGDASFSTFLQWWVILM